MFRQSAFAAAAAAIGRPDLQPHELRHTAASLAIASGASVKGVQSMLGHASAAMTLDRYGHLLGDELDAVADRLDAARAASEAAAAPTTRANAPKVRPMAAQEPSGAPIGGPSKAV